MNKQAISVKEGKIRTVYELDSNELLIVTSDRISVFDAILPILIPNKGKILNQLSAFWFRFLAERDWRNHFITDSVDEMGLGEFLDVPINVDSDGIGERQRIPLDDLRGKSMLVTKTTPFPIEAIVRGNLVGSGWKEYQQSGTLAGEPLPEGLLEADTLPVPAFTPSTKAETGHDENITIDQMNELIGRDCGNYIQKASLDIFKACRNHAQQRGIIIADTKFEFGNTTSEDASPHRLWLIDEVCTPDSSRFWDAKTFRPGSMPPSFDKQPVRDYCRSVGFTGEAGQAAPDLPEYVVKETQDRYSEAFTRLTGKAPVL